MTHKSDEHLRDNLGSNDEHPFVCDRVQELAWAKLDELIDDDEIRLRDNLLLSGNRARETYVRCVQMHAGLLAHFATPSPAGLAMGTG
jgi:hypothetical protein